MSSKKVKRKRGRPKKNAGAVITTPSNASDYASPRRRGLGRPRKQPATVATTSTASDAWDPSRPFIRELHLTPLPEQFRTKTITIHKHKFVFPRPRPCLENPEEVAMRLNCIFMPDALARNIFQRTLEYVDVNGVPHNKRFKLALGDIYHFFAMIYYMGYCPLPAIADRT